MTRKQCSGIDDLTKDQLINQIDRLIEDLSQSQPVFKPDVNAGNMLVDPVVISALAVYWEAFKETQP